MARVFLQLLCVALLCGKLPGQTCCSGGVPVSGNLGLPPATGRTLQASLTYDLNALETLQTGARVQEDNSRRRLTHSILLELGYAFDERFSVDGFFSYVRQERQIRQFGNLDLDITNGVGDAVLLFKYRLFGGPFATQSFFTGLGVKAPLGASDRRDETGIAFNADLQPGSGAWDGLLWAQYSRSLVFRPSLSLTATGIATFRGKNREYLGEETYQFGRELFVVLGLSDRLLVGKALLDPSFSLRFRTVQPDRFNQSQMPGTGGTWLFANPAITYWLTDRLSVNAGISLPLFANVRDTQVTPTYRLTTGIYYRFDRGGAGQPFFSLERIKYDHRP